MITVIDNITRSTVGRIELNTDRLTLAPNAETDLIPIIYPKDVYGNGFLNKSLTWSSSDEGVVTVSEGHLKAVSGGTAVVRAVSDDIGREAECVVTVADGGGMAISGGGSSLMAVGETAHLNADCGGEVVWRSDNSYIADVDENGNVTAYSNSLVPVLADNPDYKAGSDKATEATDKIIVFEYGKAQYETGTVKLYATSVNGGETAVYEVAVNDAEQAVHAVAISSESLAMAKGTEQYLTAAVLPASLMDARVTWSSSDESVVRVTPVEDSAEELSRALVAAVGAGEAEITAEYKGVKDICTVTVTESAVPVSEISISGKQEIELDESSRLDLSLNPDAADKSVVWISTDADKLSVSNEGVIAGMKPGNVKVYAAAADKLTEDEREKLKELAAVRTLGDDNAELAAALENAAYACAEITVKDREIPRTRVRTMRKTS